MTSTDHEIAALLDALRSGEDDWQTNPDTGIPHSAGIRLHSLLVRDQAIREAFDDRYQWHGRGCSRVSLKMLRDWLSKVTTEKGGEAAVSALRRYLEHETQQLHVVMLLAGARTEPGSEFALGNGVRLVSQERLPFERFRRNWFPSSVSSSISCGLVRTVEVPRAHTKTADSAPYNWDFSHEKNLEIARLSLAMCRIDGAKIAQIGTIVAPDDDVPSYGAQAITRPNIQHLLIDRNFMDGEIARASTIFSRLSNLREPHLQTTKLPIEKLSLAYNEGGVRGAEALRTALELIFLTDNEVTEMSYRLGLRAALFLSDDLTSRQKIFKDVKQSYSVCSKSVHRGMLPSKPAELKLISETLELARQALIRLLDVGSPSWHCVELSGGNRFTF
ncbi:MAG: hypothetical protein R3B09_09725 [Nannocystaceae bacterium]